MPDISLCDGGSCPRKQECYRFTAKPDPGEWQVYFSVPPYDYQDAKACDLFMPNQEVPSSTST